MGLTPTEHASALELLINSHARNRLGIRALLGKHKAVNVLSGWRAGTTGLGPHTRGLDADPQSIWEEEGGFQLSQRWVEKSKVTTIVI